MIDRLIDKLFAIDIKKDPRRAILAGGWIVLFACLVLLFDGSLALFAAVIALVGIAFVIAGIYYRRK